MDRTAISSRIFFRGSQSPCSIRRGTLDAYRAWWGVILWWRNWSYSKGVRLSHPLDTGIRYRHVIAAIAKHGKGAWRQSRSWATQRTGLGREGWETVQCGGTWGGWIYERWDVSRGGRWWRSWDIWGMRDARIWVIGRVGKNPIRALKSTGKSIIKEGWVRSSYRVDN